MPLNLTAWCIFSLVETNKEKQESKILFHNIYASKICRCGYEYFNGITMNKREI